jgi:hypothetical protein
VVVFGVVVFVLVAKVISYFAFPPHFVTN